MDINSNLLQSFLIVYFYKIENLLNENSSGLENVKFQSEEANTDEHLKVFFQKFLTKNNNINDSLLEQLIVKVDDNEHSIKIKNLLN